MYGAVIPGYHWLGPLNEWDSTTQIQPTAIMVNLLPCLSPLSGFFLKNKLAYMYSYSILKSTFINWMAIFHYHFISFQALFNKTILLNFDFNFFFLLTRAQDHPCSIVIKPTKGDFLNDYQNKHNLHIGITNSKGFVIEYDSQGIHRWVFFFLQK